MRLTEAQLRRYIRGSIRSLLREAEGDDAAKEIENLDVSAGPSDAVNFLNKAGTDPRVRELLRAGRNDGDEKDESGNITASGAQIGDLTPTQVEIELSKSIAYPLSSFKTMKKMISGGTQKIGPPGNDMIVKSGDFIIDGHHRWSSLFSVAGPEGSIAAINIDLPESDAASILSIVQAAIASTIDGPVPSAKAGGMNILGKGKSKIADLISSAVGQSSEAGKILSDEFVEACIADSEVSAHFGIDDDAALEDAREAIIDKVADNLSKMNQPASGAPRRVDMPQLDKASGGVEGALKALSAGDVNYKAPFVKEKEPKKESRAKHNNDQLILERWQKLAGIIKG